MYAEQQGNLLKYRIKSRYDNNPLVHVGSLEYVRGFACGYGEEGGDRIIIVKTNPADVVSVPHDCEYQKVRTAKYTVVSEYTGPLPDYVSDEEPEEKDPKIWRGSKIIVTDGKVPKTDGQYVAQVIKEILALNDKIEDEDDEDEEEEFEEEYHFVSSTASGHPVSKYRTGHYDDPVLWDMARKAVAAGLNISVIDQDGVQLEGDMRRYL